MFLFNLIFKLKCKLLFLTKPCVPQLLAPQHFILCTTSLCQFAWSLLP